MSKIVFCGYGKLGKDCLIELLRNNYEISFILTHSDMSENSVDKLANEKKIQYFYNDLRKDNNLEQINSIQENDILVSVNYRFILEEVFFNKFKYALNIHGSLLPKYRGRTPHVWAIINGESESGITCHLIDKGIDTGNIIKQRRVIIENNDTGYTLLKKYESLYPELLIDSLISQEQKNNTIEQKNSDASYFGKREPIMGYINFYDDAINVINFVRAQANPYPGAYCYLLNGTKLIIDKIEISSLDDNKIINIATPIKINNIYYVKCNNKILKIIKYR
jgi:methionyl-tRNA formyltransferase